jgi:hypothetical protein
MGPPKHSGLSCEQYGQALSVDKIDPIRRNPCDKEHKAHADEEQDLYDQAACWAATALQMLDADASNAEDIQQDQRR